VLKLLVEEAHSEDMAALYDATVASSHWVSSDLLRLEVTRAMRRLGAAMLPEADLLLDVFDLVEMSPRLVTAAAAEPDPDLRSLDAIHVATARVLRADVVAFVSYDDRQIRAAAGAGLPVLSPGR
jgi:hypothetical protein